MQSIYKPRDGLEAKIRHRKQLLFIPTVISAPFRAPTSQHELYSPSKGGSQSCTAVPRISTAAGPKQLCSLVITVYHSSPSSSAMLLRLGRAKGAWTDLGETKGSPRQRCCTSVRVVRKLPVVAPFISTGIAALSGP